MKRRIKPNGPYFLVGEIRKSDVAGSDYQSAPIFISPSLYDHILKDHPELRDYNLDPKRLVYDIMGNFSEIRKGSHGSLILVRKGYGKPRIAAIGLEIKRDRRFNFWIGKTAWIINDKRINNKPLVGKLKKPVEVTGRLSRGKGFRKAR